MKSLTYGSLQDESTYFLSLLTIHQGEFSYTESPKKRSNNLTLQSLKAWSQILHNIKTTNSSSDAIGFHGPEKQMKYCPMLSEQCCAMTEVNKWFDMKMQQKKHLAKANMFMDTDGFGGYRDIRRRGSRCYCSCPAEI